jgi:hypothetical protein
VPPEIYRNGRVYWKVRCDCGTERDVAGIHLKSGHTKSCGCLQRDRAAASASRRLIDLTGQTFGCLTVLTRDISQKRVKPYWLCRCVCGGTASVSSANLRGENAKSCGCRTRELISAANGNRFLGRRFGMLLVVQQRPSKSGHTRWLCRCDCGSELTLSSNQLAGKCGFTNCGCIARTITAEQLQTLVGRQYGYWTVVAYDGREHGRLRYRCRCACGTERDVWLSNLEQGLSTNCGCVREQGNSARLLDNLTGRTFGKLRVIERALNNKHQHTMWLCQCECGNTINVVARSLKIGRTATCGCGKLLPTSARNRVLTRYQTAATKRRIEWLLTPQQVFAIMAMPCRYCGDPPRNVTETPSERFIWNGIDRRDNQVGYTATNSVACCTVCNRMKSTMSAEEFVARMAKIQQHQE